ncbi:hypothetical protein ACWEVM_07105 [Streptomyces bauhiniae]|uniref:hypothetical protein n=1 Tax=Streptomyces bauhiniae TaxID=2340725 RepID=UPI00367674CF
MAPPEARTDDFWRVVRTLQQAARQAVYADSEWETQLRAAQKEAGEGRRQKFVKSSEREAGRRFVRPHAPAFAAAPEAVQGRTDERAIMNSFVRETGSAAPSYLCWYADAPVGKSALLADYVRRPPRGVDILNFFVSAEHGSDTRAAFEAQVGNQIRELLQASEPIRPPGSREWHRLFAEATKRNGKLLLVVDGLDDDVAWSAPAVRGVRGSIAALLPLAPPPGMRVIVSLRRCVRFPDDLAPTHPLRSPENRRTLTPLTGIPLVRRTPPDATPLGSKVAQILAVSGGGLRTDDLAELADFPAESVDRWAQGPGGRALVFEDPVLGTYTLAQPSHATATRASLAAEGVARCTSQLLAWSGRWRTAGWPDGTPPYPLAHQLRLLADPEERAEYVLDLPRLRRLVARAGLDAALAQLDRFEEETGATDTAPASLAVLVRLAATWDVLRGESRGVPSGAPALLVRLGETERARALARSAATAVDRALHLADVAVELAHVKRDGAEAVAREAAELFCQVPPDAHEDPEIPVRLLGAAEALTSLKSHDAARLLLHAVAGDRTAGTEVLTRAAALLTTVGDPALLTVLRERAEDLSQGGVRARAVAVDLWGALARATSVGSVPAGDRIEAICEELEPGDGLGAVGVLAVAVSALIALPHKRQKVARGLLRDALDRIVEALADPDALSLDDQAHSRRELAGTLARLTLAVDGAVCSRGALDDMRRMLDSLPEQLRTGVLGDVTAERARTVAEAAEVRRAEERAKGVAAAKEAKHADRRAKDAVAKEMKAEARRTREASRRKGAAAQAPPPVQVRTPGPGSPRLHRPSTGLSPAGDVQPPEHLRLLREADDRLGAGDLLRSRELLDAALRRSPLSSASPLPALAGRQADLAQALGMAGEFSQAEALARGMPDRARHVAALSLGCSLGGHTDPGAHYAREAARLVSGDTDPSSANAVAQALAHAGEGSAARALVTGRVAEKRQALTAVAAGLVRHDPEEAARVAQPLVKALVLRSDGDTTLRTVPALAALLLACPEVRHPCASLREAFRLALVPAGQAAQSWHAPSLTVLALLAWAGCVPGEECDTVTGMVDRWRGSLRHRQQSYAELALLSAVYGDEAELRHYAEAAPTPYERAVALGAAATHLAGTPVALATDSHADDKVLRTCLALARASADGRPPDAAMARSIVRRLLRLDAWAHAILLLPKLAPAALTPVSEIAQEFRRRTDSPMPEQVSGPARPAMGEDGPHVG